MADCLYVFGTCDHADCAAWPYDNEPRQGPTVEDECESHGHAYYGDDGAPPNGRGRCYCGARIYPAGGPVAAPQSGEDRHG